MKKLSLAVVILVFSCSFFLSCSKGKVSRNPVFSAIVNGAAWNLTTYNLDITGTKFEIEAIQTNGSSNQYINLHIPFFTGVGTYHISDSSNTAFYASDVTMPHSGVSGDIVIATYTDSTATGTFNFVTDQSDNITDGRFNIAH